METVKQFIPQKKIVIDPKDKPWINAAVKAKIKERNKYHRRMKSSNNEELYATYKLKRIEANMAMMQAKQSYIEKTKSKLCDANTSSKQYWHLIKNIYGNKIDVGIPALIENGSVVSSAKEKAEIFNEHFLNKSKLPDSLPKLPILEISENEISLIQTNAAEVGNAIKSLNISKANGYDNISNKLLKMTVNSISRPIANLFNKSLSNGVFPTIWKKANVSPIFKQNDKQNKNNYRPISLLSNMGKLFERIVFKHLYAFCMQHKLLTWRNSGYKLMDSSINQLIFITHNIYKALEKGDDVCFVSLDATAAFDRVWHDALIYKLRSKGVTGPLLNWLKSYLSNRFQRVVIKGQYSEWAQIKAGVPQGSILGPLLFLIYVDDIVNGIESNIYLFADDTSLLENLTDPILSFEKLNRDLSKLDAWSKQWLVSFNPTKTKYIIFSKKKNKQNYPDLFLGGLKLKKVDEIKQLGVTFAQDMSFDVHIKNNCTKAMNRLTALKRAGFKLTKRSKLQIYTAFIRPILEFGFQLYVNSSLENLKLLDVIQRQSLLFITSAYKKTSNNELHKEVGIPYLESRRNMQMILFMYKAQNCLLPNYILDIIPTNIGRQNYDIRYPNLIPQFRSQKNYFLKSFIPSAIKLWNETQLDIRKSTTLSLCKKKLKDIYSIYTYPLFLDFEGTGPINHSRMRMGLSGLNCHRKKYNFIDYDMCDLCHLAKEDTTHFFLYCPAHAAQRQELLDGLSREIPMAVQTHIENYHNNRNIKSFINILVNGTKNKEIDNIIFKHIFDFINNTQRFV